MSTLIPSSFSRFEVTDTEALEGSVFSDKQLVMLQNQLADVAEQKINTIFDATNPTQFAQDEAFLSGQIKILQYLMETSQVAAETLYQTNNTNSED